MFCSSVKPQNWLQEQHGTNTPGTPKRQTGVYQSCTPQATAAVSQRCPSALTTVRPFTLGFWEEADVQLCLTPLLEHRGHFNTAASACRVTVKGKSMTAGHWLAARLLCCSTVTVGFTSATFPCGNEVLPKDHHNRTEGGFCTTHLSVSRYMKYHAGRPPRSHYIKPPLLGHRSCSQTLWKNICHSRMTCFIRSLQSGTRKAKTELCGLVQLPSSLQKWELWFS